MENDKNVGKVVYENLHKKSERIPVVDLQQELQKDWPDRIIKIAEEDKKYCDEKNIQYSYLHIILRKHPHLPGTIDEKFISRLSAPAMTPSSTLYRFDHQNENIELVWSLPPPEIIQDIIQYPMDYSNQPDLVKFCMAYNKGFYEKVS
jgi:hypothetical protein